MRLAKSLIKHVRLCMAHTGTLLWYAGQDVSRECGPGQSFPHSTEQRLATLHYTLQHLYKQEVGATAAVAAGHAYISSSMSTLGFMGTLLQNRWRRCMHPALRVYC